MLNLEDITNVSLVPFGHSNIEVNICFCYQTVPYFIKFVKGPEIDEIFIKTICHDTDQYCPLCKQENIRDCEVLDEHVDELFDYLIECNEIRLLWLLNGY